MLFFQFEIVAALQPRRRSRTGECPDCTRRPACKDIAGPVHSQINARESDEQEQWANDSTCCDDREEQADVGLS